MQRYRNESGSNPREINSSIRKTLPEDLAIFAPSARRCWACTQYLTCWPTERGLALGDLILVVREDVVHAAGMYVEFLTQVFRGHSGAFDVPSGETFSPRAVPLQVAARLGGFPESEVPGVSLQRVGLSPDTFQQVGAGVPGEFAVIFEHCYVIVDVPALLVGKTPVDKLGHDVQHLRDMAGGLREHLGGFYVYPRLVPVEYFSVIVGDVLGCFAFSQRGHDNLVAAGFNQLLAHVAHVSNVLNLVDLVALVFDDPANPVGHHVGTQVSDVGVAVHCRAAGVHADPVWFQGLDFFHYFSSGYYRFVASCSPLYPRSALNDLFQTGIF